MDFKSVAFKETDNLLALIDASTLISVADANGLIIHVNENFTKVLEYSDSELIGQNYRIFDSGTHDREFFGHLWSHVFSGKMWTGEICNRSKSGKKYWLRTSILPIKNEKGEVEKFFSIQYDITEVKKETELNLKIQNEFLSRLSHEIKTPLNAILGMTDLIEQTEINSEQKDYVETIQKSSQRLLTLVNKTLEYSKIENDLIEIVPSKFSMDAELVKLKELYFSSSELKKIKFIIRNELDTDYFEGDHKRIFQIVNYYLENAFRFTQKGEVSLTIKKNDKDDILFEVRDTGIGIQPDRNKNIFRPFAFEHYSTTDDFNGLGLSLAISKKIAEKLNGNVGSKSSFGHGSLFWLTTPLVKVSKVDQLNIEISKINFSELKVLIVEDDLINQRLLKKMLNKLNVFPDVVSNGLEALEVQKGNKYNLIFMDINMPILDGLETTRRIKENPSDYGMPFVVAITANSVTGDREKCLNAKMDEYISKPIKREYLEKLLLKVVNYDFGSTEIKEKSNIKNRNRIKFYLEKVADDYKGDEEILNYFIQELIIKVPMRLEKIDIAIAQNNFDTILIEAHNLKDLIGSLYQEELRRNLEKLEDYGREKRTSNIRPMFLDIKWEVEQFIEELDNQFLKKAA